MRTLFFYGTLRHIPLLEIVLGRHASVLDLADDRLTGFDVFAAVEGPFPLPRPAEGRTAAGVLVRGLSEEDIARLDFYEAGFDYDLVTLTTESGADAEVYLPAVGVWTAAEPWDFAAWVHRWGAMTEYAAREVMDQYGAVSPQEIARHFPRIRARAWSKVLAQSSRHGAGTLHGRVDIAARRQAYSNFFALEELRLYHERFDGTMSAQLDRAIFVASDAAMVLPYDPIRDRVLLVEQVRMGPIGRADPACWQMEPIAGFVDPGERPEDTARREAAEEAGLTLRELIPAAEGYPSPGGTTEFYHLFVGLCDLPDDVAGVGGALDEGENIRSHTMGFGALLTLAEDRRTGNTPLTLLTYWLAHHRTRLRAGEVG